MVVVEGERGRGKDVLVLIWMWREKKEHRKGGPAEQLAPRRFWSMTIQLRISSRVCSWGPSSVLSPTVPSSLFTCDLFFLLGWFFSFSAGCVEGGQKHSATKRRQKSPASPKSLVSVAREQRPPGDLWLPVPDRGLVLFLACCAGTVFTEHWGFSPSRKRK